MHIKLHDIEHNYDGFRQIIEIYEHMKNCIFSDISIDFSLVNWFAADMCAAFGAILTKISNNLNTIHFENISEEVETILAKNSFLWHYGWARKHDTYASTVTYNKFDVNDELRFAEYIDREYIDKGEMPKMSEQLKKCIHSSMCELFNNAVIHSQTEEGIFSCGQYYHKKRRLDFCIADLGVGIWENVKRIEGARITPAGAIDWAMQEGNTTKRGSIPGGLGLKILKEFIGLNGGALRVVSDRGFWQFESGSVSKRGLEHPFPGTVVNVEIDTADTCSYMLSSELTEDDIF